MLNAGGQTTQAAPMSLDALKEQARACRSVCLLPCLACRACSRTPHASTPCDARGAPPHPSCWSRGPAEPAAGTWAAAGVAGAARTAATVHPPSSCSPACSRLFPPHTHTHPTPPHHTPPHHTPPHHTPPHPPTHPTTPPHTRTPHTLPRPPADPSKGAAEEGCRSGRGARRPQGRHRRRHRPPAAGAAQRQAGRQEAGQAAAARRRRRRQGLWGLRLVPTLHMCPLLSCLLASHLQFLWPRGTAILLGVVPTRLPFPALLAS